MSRLFIDHCTDSRGHGGKNRAMAEIYWGSVHDSKLAVRVEVVWNEDDKKPKIYLTKGLGMKVEFVPR